MSMFAQRGATPRKRHTQFRSPEGELYHERLMGQEGFASHWSLIYHRHAPTEITAVAAADDPREPLADNFPLRPRHLRSQDLARGGDVVTGRRLLLGNDDVRIHRIDADVPNELYRNAIGDELIFVTSGTGVLESEFGPLPFGPGDYLVIPTCTTYQVTPDAGQTVSGLLLEASSHIHPPAQFLTSRAQFVNESPMCELDFRLPEAPVHHDDTDVDVLVRTRAGLTRYTYAHHPFDIAGWFGCFYPYAFNIADYEPIAGSLHKPPTVHQVFEGDGFVICNFVPRLLDWHEDAIIVPANHANVDSDEVLFFVDGQMAQREGSGINAGSLALHPTGFVHGPHPGTVEKSLAAGTPDSGLVVRRTDETIVMVDTFRPLAVGVSGADCEDESYAMSWHAHA